MWVRDHLGQELWLAAVVGALLLAGLVGRLSEISLTDDPAVLRRPGVGGWLLLATGPLALAFRRVAPLTVLVVNVVSMLAYAALENRPPPLPLGVLVALFTVAALRGPMVCVGSLVGVVTALSVAAVLHVERLTDEQYYTYLMSIVAAVTTGYGVQLGHVRTALAEQLAGRLARDTAARTRAAVAEEQARIAREVHDIVAHDVGVIVAQAAAARRVFEPQSAAAALVSIEAVGRDALDGLRRLVGLLRTEAEQDGRSPQPGLDRLPWLLTQVERAGLPVELAVHGEPRPLPATVELNAFRIVQEALTNALKHAGPTRASVCLDYDPGSLGIEVRDRGLGVVAGNAGYGLVGMQQRVAMLGGELEAGPADGGGFAVTARLPAGGAG